MAAESITLAKRSLKASRQNSPKGPYPPRPVTRRKLPCLPVLLLATSLGYSNTDAQEDPVLKNGSFVEWSEGIPVGWESSIGATSGAGKRSVLRKGEAGGIALQGDASTKVWQYLSQTFSVRPGTSYRLALEARANGLQRDPGQFQSCYVGLAFSDSEGNGLSRAVRDVVKKEWTREEVVAQAPGGSTTGEVGIFLAKTGLLEVRSVRLETVDPRDSFKILVEEMDRHYSFFALKGIDWKTLAGRYKERAEGAEDVAEFVGVIKEMLSELEDHHVWIEMPGQGRMATFHQDVERNFDFREVASKKLDTVRQIGRVALVGRTPGGHGYVAVGSLQGSDGDFQELEKAIDGLLDAPGLLVDLRGNGGGDERRARRIAAIFADKKRVYGRSRFRSGPEHADFSEGPERTVAPREGKTFKRPIVCLIGPHCMSSGEAFVMMMKAFPRVTLIGRPTRGASGNPRPITLPNGATVFFSRWVSMLPDGTPIEGRGIAPDVVVPHEGEGDPTFDAALAELARQIKPEGESTGE